MNQDFRHSELADYCCRLHFVSESSAKTLSYYETHSEDFIASTQNVDFSQTQEKFLSYLSDEKKSENADKLILDFGCGSGRDTKYFLSKGFNVDAADGSEKMCEAASKLAGIKVKKLNFLDFSERGKYDGIWACSSILHLPKNDLKLVLQKICAALKPNGVFYTSFKYGNFEGFRNGRYFTDLTEKSFSQLVDELNLAEKKDNLLRANQTNLRIVNLWISEDARKTHAGEKWLNAICIQK